MVRHGDGDDGLEEYENSCETEEQGEATEE